MKKAKNQTIAKLSTTLAFIIIFGIMSAIFEILIAKSTNIPEWFGDFRLYSHIGLWAIWLFITVKLWCSEIYID